MCQKARKAFEYNGPGKEKRFTIHEVHRDHIFPMAIVSHHFFPWCNNSHVPSFNNTRVNLSLMVVLNARVRHLEAIYKAPSVARP